MKLYLIGLGPGDPELLTLKALRLIQRLPVLFYPKEEGREPVALGIARPFLPEGKPLLPLPLFTGGDPKEAERARREAARRVREALSRYGEGGYLVLGDSLLYASPLNLLPHLEGVAVEAVPGISAHQLAAASLLKPIALGEEGFAAVTGLGPVDPEGLDRFQSVFVYKAKDLGPWKGPFPTGRGGPFCAWGCRGNGSCPWGRPRGWRGTIGPWWGFGEKEGKDEARGARGGRGARGPGAPHGEGGEAFGRGPLRPLHGKPLPRRGLAGACPKSGASGLQGDDLGGDRPGPGRGGPEGRGVVRLHSGDPGLYGTLLEEKEALEALGVGVEVVPGVTAAFALAARAGLSLTAPGVAQAVAFTRLGVRTPVPEGQDPKSLARKGLTLAVYLSGMHPRRLSRELLEAGLPGDTPVLYGHKVAQPGEEVGLTDLKGLAHLPARDTTVYLVGEALRAKGVRSLLYDPSFKHRYRR